MSYSRRQFLQHSGRVLAATSLSTGLSLDVFSSSRRLAPSDTVVVGLIGCRNQGYWDFHHALRQPGVVCGGICDVDQSVLETRALDVEKLTGKKPRLFHDFREMLDDQEIDAVMIGTPDHWHALQATLACEAGKDVYVEKPMANSIEESRAIVRSARHYHRIVQVGQQQRSGPHFAEVVSLIQAGRIGKIRHVKLWANFFYGMADKKIPDEPPPEGFDYDLWLGPAPQKPYNANRVHRFWRFHWDYGGGLMTDWGVHLLDIPLWALQINAPPRSVTSIGGIFAYPDRALETADTQTVLYEFDDFNMVWEHTGGIQHGPYGRHYGIAFVGTDGTLVLDRAGWELHAEVQDGVPRTESVPLQKSTGESHEAHVRNFIECVRSRNEPNCTVEAGYLAAIYAHLGNIAYRTRSRLTWDAQTRQFQNNEPANKLLLPTYRAPWRLPTI